MPSCGCRAAVSLDGGAALAAASAGCCDALTPVAFRENALAPPALAVLRTPCRRGWTSARSSGPWLPLAGVPSRQGPDCSFGSSGAGRCRRDAGTRRSGSAGTAIACAGRASGGTSGLSGGNRASRPIAPLFEIKGELMLKIWIPVGSDRPVTDGAAVHGSLVSHVRSVYTLPGFGALRGDRWEGQRRSVVGSPQ
jgi:hypothetical protein